MPISTPWTPPHEANPRPKGAERLHLAQNSVGWTDFTRLDRIELTGSDRALFLHNLCTNDIQKLEAGRSCEAFFLNAKGKILDYGRVFSIEESLWIELEPGRADVMTPHLDRFLFREDVQIHNRSTTHVQFHVCGPKASSVLPVGELGDRRAAGLTWEGIECQFRRRDRSIEGGWDIVAPVDHASALWELLRGHVVRVGGAHLDEADMEVFRVEAGLPVFGREVTEDNLAQEIGRDMNAISFHKGCYIGQETVARLDALGHVNKLLQGLRAPVGTLRSGQEVRVGDKVIGTVSSAVDSPRFGSSLGLAILRVQGGSPGSVVQTEAGEARVVSLPFSESG